MKKFLLSLFCLLTTAIVASAATQIVEKSVDVTINDFSAPTTTSYTSPVIKAESEAAKAGFDFAGNVSNNSDISLNKNSSRTSWFGLKTNTNNYTIKKIDVTVSNDAKGVGKVTAGNSGYTTAPSITTGIGDDFKAVANTTYSYTINNTYFCLLATTNGLINISNIKITYEVEQEMDDSKGIATLTWGETPSILNMGEDINLTDYINVTPQEATPEIVFTTSDATIASVENNILKGLNKGIVKISAYIPDTSETFNSTIPVEFEIKIQNPNTKIYDYEVMTSDMLQSLEEVTPIIIVCSSNNTAFGSNAITSRINYGNSTSIELTNGIIKVEDDTETIQLFNLHKSADGKYAFECVNGVNAGKYINSTAARSLSLSEEIKNATSVTISAEGNATISFGSTVGNLQYNSSNPRFTTYASGQTAIQIFTIAQPKEPKTPTFTGWNKNYVYQVSTDEMYTIPVVTTDSDGEIKYDIYDFDGVTVAQNATIEIGETEITVMAQPGAYVIKATTAETANFKAGETSTVIEIISGDVTAEGFDFTADVNVYGMTTDPAEDAFESAVNELVHEGGNVTIFFEKGNNFRHVTHDGYKALEVAAGHSFFIKATNGNRLTSVTFDGLDNFDVEENGKPTPAQPANAPRRAAVAGNGWTAPASDGNSADITSLKVTVPAGAENAFIKTINFSTAKNTATGVEEIATESVSEIYTINGVRVNGTVDTLAPGLYILREGTRTVKILVK